VRTASQLADEIASDVLPPLPDSRWLSSRVSEQPGRLDQQHHGRDQIEHGELDLGEELNFRSAHEAHDQRADERALQAAEAADDDDDGQGCERAVLVLSRSAGGV
jgi:hypothetical protein